MKILVTGFDPFGGEAINPSSEVLKLLPDKIEESELIKLVLPTVFRKSLSLLVSKVEEVKPDIVISIGQAGGREAITFERVAINIDDARIPDNEGNQPIDEIIYPEGQTAYFSTIPIKRMVEAVKEKGIPAAVSNSAGTFVCNHVLYGILHYRVTQAPHLRAGFIHIPLIEEQARGRDIAYMKLDTIAEGIVAGIKALIKNPEDVRIIGGSIH